ncbi:MAG: ABC transporter ATP-binding protein [Planctomycetota bacterium]|nr:MAG: ABC transporter ATP-binding protein [Planctomycetota bacterium]
MSAAPSPTPLTPPPLATLRTVLALSRAEHHRFAIAAGALFLGAIFLYLVPLVPQAIFDVVIGDESKASTISQRVVAFLGGAATVRESLWRPALLMGALAVLAALAVHVKTRIAMGAAERIARQTRDRMYDRVQRLPVSTLDRIPSGDLIQRCTSDIETTRNFFAGQAPEIIRAVLMLVIPLPIMAMLDWRMAIASIVCVPVMLIYTAVNFRRMGPYFGVKETTEASMTANVTENLTGIRTVRAFGRAEFEMRRFEVTSGAYRDADAKLFRLFASFWSTSDLLCFAQQVIVVGLGAWFLSNGSLELGAYFYFLTVVSMFIWPVRMLGRMVVESGKALAAVARLDEILKEQEERDLDANTLRSALVGESTQKSSHGMHIVFDRVSFAYSGGPRVLDDISFVLPAGKTLALIGPSGAGKSTIVQLLLRFYEPNSGSITVDGIPLAQIARATIRSQSGVVLQQPFLYSKQLRENLLAGVRVASAHDGALESATATACIHETILGFPEGYETVVGEKGLTLSGGQRQRVAIARALVQAPRLLVLDDALSAVDMHTETAILASLRARQHFPTRILVAHRLSAVVDADLILVIVDGRIAQRGTHATLTKEPGLYQTLWEIQTEVADPDAIEEEVSA